MGGEEQIEHTGSPSVAAVPQDVFPNDKNKGRRTTTGPRHTFKIKSR